MPNSVVKSLAKKNNLSIDKVEDIWKDSEKIVKDIGMTDADKNFYPLITFFVKKKIKKLK